LSKPETSLLFILLANTLAVVVTATFKASRGGPAAEAQTELQPESEALDAPESRVEELRSSREQAEERAVEPVLALARIGRIELGALLPGFYEGTLDLWGAGELLRGETDGDLQLTFSAQVRAGEATEQRVPVNWRAAGGRPKAAAARGQRRAPLACRSFSSAFGSSSFSSVFSRASTKKP
jgi:hypothetical protein